MAEGWWARNCRLLGMLERLLVVAGWNDWKWALEAITGACDFIGLMGVNTHISIEHSAARKR